MTASIPASAGPPDRSGEDKNEAGLPAEVLQGSFARATRSEGVDHPPSIHEIETHREHIRLNLENWEKQWADVLRYERAKVQDDANLATIRRALTRAGACLALAVSLLAPVVTDGDSLRDAQFGLFSLRDVALVAATTSAVVMISSMWYAAHVFMARRRFKKSRTRPLKPPERLDAVQLVASLTHEGDPLYYRERDVDPGTAFGWKHGFPLPPKPEE